MQNSSKLYKLSSNHDSKRAGEDTESNYQGPTGRRLRKLQSPASCRYHAEHQTVRMHALKAAGSNFSLMSPSYCHLRPFADESGRQSQLPVASPCCARASRSTCGRTCPFRDAANYITHAYNDMPQTRLQHFIHPGRVVATISKQLHDVLFVITSCLPGLPDGLRHLVQTFRIWLHDAK